MPFNRPTLAELIDRAAGDIEAALPGADARLRRSNLGVLSRVLAAEVHQLYGALQQVEKELFIDTCSAGNLDRHAAVWRLGRRGAQFAEGPVVFGGANGALVPAGARVVRADGVEYETIADAVIAAGAATAQVMAVAAGVDGNAAGGTAVSLVSSIANVQARAAVGVGGIVGGAGVESDASLRDRVLAEVRGGDAVGRGSDYVKWAKEVSGVTRAWAFAGEAGPGTVVVRFVRDGDPSIFPGPAAVQAVQDQLDLRRPVTAAVTATSPTARPIDFAITVVPATQAVRDAVQAELADLLLREGEPNSTVTISRIREAISVAAGEANHNLIAPGADVVLSSTQIATLGTITWS